jgi:hypothetical protein
VKLFSWIAGIALVFAAVFFLRYSAERGWLSPVVRMSVGVIAGAALLVVCEWKAARRYAITANSLDASGIAILFATFFAGNRVWDLLPALPAFGLMALVTTVAVLLSVRHDSLFIAVLGLLGGFATPALLSTGEDRPIGLFGYLLLLNAGLSWVAYRKRWPALTVLSTILTVLYQWYWVVTYLQTGTVPLSLGIFLIFPILSFVALSLGTREKDEDRQTVLFRHTAAIGAALPMLFAMYLATIAAYGTRYWLLFGFVFLVDIGLAAIAWKRGPEMLHLLGGMGTLLSLGLFLRASYTGEAWPAILLITCVFVLFYLAAGYWLPFRGLATRGVYAAPALLVAFPVLAAIEPATASPATLFSVLFLLMSGIAAYAVVRRDGAIHFLAGLFAITTEAIWSAKYLDSVRLTPALSIYATFGLFFLAVPFVAHHLKRVSNGDVLNVASYLALSSHVFLFVVSLRESLAVPPWPFLAVLAVLDVAILLSALYTWRTELHLAATAGSQIIFIGWQLTASSEPWPSVATVCTMAIAIMALGGLLLGRKLHALIADRSSILLTVASIGASVLGLVALGVSITLSGSPSLALVSAAMFVFVALLLATDHLAVARAVSPFSVLPAAWVLWVWSRVHFAADQWSHELLLASVMYVLFLAYPLFLGARVKLSIGPHLAAVLASVAFFFFARHSLLAGGFAGVIGLLPVTQAALLGLLLWNLLKQEAVSPRVVGRVALVAGAVLGFITVAIPLQLEKQWITVGWALQAAALAWLIGRVPHKGLYWWTSGLLAAVFVRLALNPAVLTYHPRSETPIFNWYLYTYLISAASLLVSGWLLRRVQELWKDIPKISPLASAGGAVLLFLLLNIEIADYYSTGTALTFSFNAGLAQNLTYTIGWAVFAFGLLVVGILIGNKGARVASIALLSVTVGKCFLYDLRSLGGLYRVASLVGLAICLTMVALLLQKFVLGTREESE